MVLFGGLDPGEDYLYHYTSAAILDLILRGGSLRLGPYAGTRDPRENLAWHPGFSAAEDVDSSPEVFDMASVSEELDRAIRQRARMTCLTIDYASDAPFDSFSRGWGRARMWDQYADRHRGAVLMFERSALDRNMQEALGPKGPFFAAPVVYADEPLNTTHELHFDVGRVLAGGLDKLADEVVQEHGRSLFFGKNTDWQTESEYRYLVLSDGEEEFVPVGDALVGVVLGMDFPPDERPLVRSRLRELGRPELPVVAARWHNGMPLLVPSGV